MVSSYAKYLLRDLEPKEMLPSDVRQGAAKRPSAGAEGLQMGTQALVSR